MNAYSYRILNVFAVEGERLSGNPLCVFEDARGLDDATLQALALQFNLSETTFVLPSDRAAARVRIFTPYFEMPFAGHPTLGTAQVVRDIRNTDGSLTLEMQAGIISVSAENETWTLQASAPQWRDVEATRPQLALMLGIDERDVGARPLWVNTGSEQLVIPLNTPAAVARCAPKAELLQRYGGVNDQRFLAYVWSEADQNHIHARFFFAKGGACAEDPATGSACANLGGWLIATEADLPLTKRISQGSAVKRPSRLELRVDAQRTIFVSGLVIEIGRGVISI